MKTWSFVAEYTAKRFCTISANTEEEARDLFEAGEWEEELEVDSILQDATPPKWDNFIE